MIELHSFLENNFTPPSGGWGVNKSQSFHDNCKPACFERAFFNTTPTICHLPARGNRSITPATAYRCCDFQVPQPEGCG